MKISQQLVKKSANCSVFVDSGGGVGGADLHGVGKVLNLQPLPTQSSLKDENNKFERVTRRKRGKYQKCNILDTCSSKINSIMIRMRLNLEKKRES